MKTLKFLSVLVISAALFTACEKEENKPNFREEQTHNFSSVKDGSTNGKSSELNLSEVEQLLDDEDKSEANSINFFRTGSNYTYQYVPNFNPSDVNSDPNISHLNTDDGWDAAWDESLTYHDAGFCVNISWNQWYINVNIVDC